MRLSNHIFESGLGFVAKGKYSFPIKSYFKSFDGKERIFTIIIITIIISYQMK